MVRLNVDGFHVVVYDHPELETNYGFTTRSVEKGEMLGIETEIQERLVDDGVEHKVDSEFFNIVEVEPEDVKDIVEEELY